MLRFYHHQRMNPKTWTEEMYHYTTIYHLPFILRDGLRPRAMGAVNHLNDWKLGLQLAGSNISTIRPLLWGTRSPIPDKTATGAFHGLPPIRLSVPNDGFLKDWGRFYPPDEATYLRRLGRKVGSNPNDWFVRLEKISPHLVKVDSEDIPSYRFLSD